MKKYPKLFQWLFLLIVFFALCFAIDVPETYKFIRGQAEFVKDPNQSSYVFLGKEVRYLKNDEINTNRNLIHFTLNNYGNLSHLQRT